MPGRGAVLYAGYGAVAGSCNSVYADDALGDKSKTEQVSGVCAGLAGKVIGECDLSAACRQLAHQGSSKPDKWGSLMPFTVSTTLPTVSPMDCVSASSARAAVGRRAAIIRTARSKLIGFVDLFMLFLLLQKTRYYIAAVQAYSLNIIYTVDLQIVNKLCDV